ncbi:MAG: alcohol dehydrogenase catalytic domain-containing protein [Ruthenibacterium sp.]
MKCDAVWVVKPNEVEIRPVEVRDEPLADEVQIDVKVCGLCAWDSYLFQGISGPGDPPYPIGHEAAGVITKVGSLVTDFKVGDKVAVCSGTDSQEMAKVVNNKAAGVCRLPDTLTNWADAVYEPTCCVVNLLYKSDIQPGDRVVLVGCGYMGSLTLQGLVNGSCAGYISVFEKRPERRELAKKLGADFVFDPYSAEGKKHIEEIAAAGGADVVIDFGASETGYEVATAVLKDKPGKLVLGSWHRHEMKFDGTRWHMGGVTVYNLSPMSNAHYFDLVPRCATLIDKGVYNPGSLVSHVVHYKDAKLADIFEKSISKEDGYMKAVISFEDK